MTDPLSAAARLAAEGLTGVLATVLGGDAIGIRTLFEDSGERLAGNLPSGMEDGLRRRVAEAAASRRSMLALVNGVEVFFEVVAPPPTLRIFGAGPIAEALCRMAAVAGYRVVVGDPRPTHARPDRFPDADAVDVGWPADLLERRPLEGGCFVVSLLHAARFEDSLLPAVLGADPRYVGVLGSRSTHRERLERLLASGCAEADLVRLHGPVGLAIGAVTPGEIAVAILAEMVQVLRG